MNIWEQLLALATFGFLGYCIGYVKGSIKSIKEFHRFIRQVDTILSLLGVSMPEKTKEDSR